MKRKSVLLWVGLIIVFAIALVFTSCITIVSDKPANTEDSYVMDFSTVYAMAEEAGYTGTLEDLITAFKGDSAYAVAKASGYTGTVQEWLTTLRGAAGADGVTPTIGENKHWFIGDTDTGVVAEGKDGTDGVGISSIEKTGQNGLMDIYTVTLTNGQTYDFTVKNGENGENGEDAVLPAFDPDGATPNEYFTFTLTGGAYSIAARYQNMPSRLVIPGEYNGKAVKEIADGGFSGRKSITEVIIPASIENLHRHAFENCSNLKIVTFEEGSRLTSIGSLDAFAGCPIEIATIPALADTSVGNDAIKTVKYIPNGKFNSTSMVGNRAFENCKNLTSVTLAPNTSLICPYAFKNCIGLTSIVIPSGTKIIGDEAFMGSGLTSINIPNSVELLGPSVFSGCFSLTSANLSSKLTEIPDRLFCYCYALRFVNMPSTVTSIGDYAFYGNDMYTFVVPAGVESIGTGAFTSCNHLVEIYNYSEITLTKGSLENGAIASCALDIYTTPTASKLSSSDGFVVRTEGEEKMLIAYTGYYKSVFIPSDITAINKYAFFDNEVMTSVRIRKNVKTIGMAAFCGCANLTSVVIENGLTSIGTQAFYNCDNLASIVIPSTVTNIAPNAFMHCSSLASLIVAVGNPKYQSEGNCIIDKTTNKVICGCVESEIPSGTKIIGYYSFEDCVGLYSITIPDTVTDIHTSAFRQCRDLGEIKLGSGVERIDNKAFEYCTSLRAVTIPKSVKRIMGQAFANCTFLTDIYYEGTRAEWEAIDIKDGAFDANIVVHCTDDAE